MFPMAAIASEDRANVEIKTPTGIFFFYAFDDHENKIRKINNPLFFIRWGICFVYWDNLLTERAREKVIE